MPRKKLTEKELLERAWELRIKLSKLFIEEERADFEGEYDYITPDEEEKRYADIGIKKKEIYRQAKKLAKKADKNDCREVLAVLQAIAKKERK